MLSHLASLTIMFYYDSDCVHTASAGVHPDPSLSSSPERPRSGPAHVPSHRSACSGFQQKLSRGCGVITAPCISDGRFRESLEGAFGLFTFPKRENSTKEMFDVDKSVWKTHEQLSASKNESEHLRFLPQIGQLLVKM